MKRPFPVHPFFLAASPVLFLFGHSVTNLPVGPHELLLPLAVSVVLATLVLVVFGLILRDWLKAGIIASLFVLLLSLYGGAFSAIARTPAVNILARHEYLMPAWLVLWILGSWLAIRTKRSLGGFTVLLNIAAAAIVLVNVVTALPVLQHRASRSDAGPAPFGIAGRDYPDIYYIILDGYARADIMKERFGFDNSQFIDFLKSRGFSVAARSRPNYASTYLSLASSLNFMYLDSLAALIRPGSTNRGPLAGLTANSRVMAILKHHGYTTISFASGFLGTEFRNADIFLSPRLALSEFQNVLLATTPLPPLIELLTHRSQFDVQRDLLMFQLRMLPQAARAGRPVFVFCHMLFAHPPFVFGPHGEKVNPPGYFSFIDDDQFQAVGGARAREDFNKAYLGQVAFLNLKLEETIDRILAASPRPPVIVLQADHGRSLVLHQAAVGPEQVYERMAILNACLFPGDTTFFYDSITPVNTFRLILNRLFATDYPLLPDKSYFSTMAQPYVFYDVDNPASYAGMPGSSGVIAVIFTAAEKPPTDPSYYGRRITGIRYYGASRQLDDTYIRTVAKAPSIGAALDLYRSYVKSGGMPDLGDTCASYSGPGPSLEPVTALFFASPSNR